MCECAEVEISMTPELEAEKNEFRDAFVAHVLASLQGAYLVAVENGMTLEKAAEAMEMSPAQFEDIIYGRKELDLRTLVELGEVLGFDIDFDIKRPAGENKNIFPG